MEENYKFIIQYPPFHHISKRFILQTTCADLGYISVEVDLSCQNWNLKYLRLMWLYVWVNKDYTIHITKREPCKKCSPNFQESIILQRESWKVIMIHDLLQSFREMHKERSSDEGINLSQISRGKHISEKRIK